MRRGVERHRGQALTEFALVVPILSLILFGITDLGLAINDLITITNAARNGARVAALNSGSTSAVNTAVADAAPSSAPSLIRCSTPTASVTAVANASPPPTNSGWTVTVSCTYTPITPLAPLFSFFGGSTTSTYTISATNTMKDSSCLPPCH